MKTKIIAIAMAASLMLTGFAFGQLQSTGVSPSNVLDGLYVQQHIPTKKVDFLCSIERSRCDVE